MLSASARFGAVDLEGVILRLLDLLSLIILGLLSLIILGLITCFFF